MGSQKVAYMARSLIRHSIVGWFRLIYAVLGLSRTKFHASRKDFSHFFDTFLKKNPQNFLKKSEKLGWFSGFSIGGVIIFFLAQPEKN